MEAQGIQPLQQVLSVQAAACAASSLWQHACEDRCLTALMAQSFSCVKRPDRHAGTLHGAAVSSDIRACVMALHVTGHVTCHVNWPL